MRGDFSRGAGYLLKGIVYFYRTPSLWSCALIPFLMTLLLYGVLFLAAVRYGIPFCLDLLPDPEGHGIWGRWLLYPLRFLTALSCWLGMALTAILAAGLEGIEKALVLDEEAGDENAPRFPETLGILLQKLDQNEFAHRVFGEKFCRMYGEGKKEEWERFCAYVTDWETAEYLYRC